MKKRLLLGIGLPLAILPMALVACGSSEVQQKTSEYVFTVQDPEGTNKPYQFRYVSHTAGNQVQKHKYQSTDLFFETTEGNRVITATGKVNSFSKIFYKLGVAKAIYITKKDGSVAKYDSDEREKEGAVLSLSFKRMVSEVPTSINNIQFLLDLANAKKVQVTLRDDIYWVNVNGEKTEYKVIPEDYYANWKRVLQRRSKYRYQTNENGGGSAELDDKALEKWNDVEKDNSIFKKNGSFSTNEYIYPLFGIDNKKLANKNTFIQKVEGTEEEAITLESLDVSKGAQMGEAFKKMFVNSTYFVAIPSQYTKANKSKGLEGSTGEVAEYGYYWYGGNWEEMLFAGPYLPLELTSEIEKWGKNKNFYDQEWVNDPKTIDLFVTEYKKVAADKFSTDQFLNYKDGKAPYVRFSQLNTAQKNEVRSNPEKFNLNYANEFTLNSTQYLSYLWTSIPAPKNTTNKTTFNTRDYNDAFALMMWGKKISEIEDTTNSPAVSEAFYLGKALRFRSLVSNAHNMWTRSVEMNENDIPWMTTASTGNDIGGSNQELSNLKLNFDAYDDLNTSYAFDENGKIIAKKSWKDDKVHFEKIESQRDKAFAFKSSTYETIKSEMKKLLDEFFIENSSLTEKKIKFRVPLMTKNNGELELAAMNQLVKTINSLDDRIEATNATVYDDKNKEDTDRAEVSRLSGRALRWGYDYNGMGTWIDSLFIIDVEYPTEIGLLFQMASLEKDSELAKSLPQLYKLSTEFKEAKQLYPEGSPTFEERKNATIDQLFTQGNKFMNGTAQNFNIQVEMSKFFFEYQKKTSNEDLVKLAQEIQNVLGFHPSSKQGSALNPAKPQEYLRSNKFYQPVVLNGDSPSYRFWKVVDNK